jgi:hypothetical protein
MQELLESIHDSIDWLHRLSNLVRQSSFVSDNHQADGFLLGETEESHNDVIQRQRRWFRYLIESTLEGLAPFLLDRMIETMIIRYRRIQYRRFCHEIYQISPVEYKEVESDSNERQGVVPQQTTSTTPLKHLTSRNTQRMRERMTGRYTAPSINRPTWQKLTTRSQVFSSKTKLSIKFDDRDQVPDPPRSARKGANFVCTYCQLLLPSNVGSDRRLWA